MPGTPLGSALRQLRTDAKLSPDELADEAGVSRSTVYRIESGEVADPDLPTLRGLANALELPLSELFRHVETLTASRHIGDLQPSPDTGGPSGPATLPGLGPPAELLAEQSEFLERLAWACLRGANSAERFTAQSLLEELAVSFRRAADPTATVSARAEIRAARRARRDGR